jgi:cell wall-associated NlpC family hydrolase
MSFAARAARFAMVGALAAAATLSANGLASPQPVLAAGSQSAPSVQSALPAASPATSADSSAQQTNTRLSQRQRIVRIAESHLGAHYRFGAEGMKAFDCSGLVWRVFKEAGLEAKIGSARKGARAYYHWFKRQGLASRHDPKPGDLVIWHKGKHIGIYIGNGEIISALNKKYGVRVHGLDFVSGFTAYLHVRLNGKTPNDGNTGGGTELIKVKTTTDQLVMRDGPGNGHKAVATLDRGTVITVITKAVDGQGRKWVEGKLANGKVGWVRARHVRVIQ